MNAKTCPVPPRLKLMFTIVKRELGDKVAAFYREQGITFHMISPGYGAAGLEIRDFLGFSETEKDMLLSVASEEQIEELLPLAIHEFDLDSPDTGIIFTVPLAGISGPKALLYVMGFSEKE